MERYDWNEFAEAMEIIFGQQVDKEEKFAVCADCGEPVYKDDWVGHNFKTCPMCEWDVEKATNEDLDWEFIEDEKESEEGWDEEEEGD